MPIAFFIPICLGSLCIPPAKAANPTFGSGSANFALDEAIIRSHARAISIPPPIATPLTAAIIGLFKLNLLVSPANPVSGIPDLSPPEAWYLRSLPAENALSPAPVIIPTHRSSLFVNSLQTSSNSLCEGGCSEFITSGLFMVTSKI